jgi:hypothetical protein
MQKKIKSFCEGFVIVTGAALALPPHVVLLQHIVVRVPQAWMQTILTRLCKRELFTACG